MSSTLVNITQTGWTRLNMDMFYQEYSEHFIYHDIRTYITASNQGYLYHLEMERLVCSADVNNFFSYKCEVSIFTSLAPST